MQIDAHADLREDLDGERHSHACAAARALDAGATDLLQVGIRAFSMQEHERIESDARISTWFARDLFAPSSNGAGWRSWLEALKAVEGPVHLTIDVDGLCPSLVPGTGTPVPGGLAYWHAVETIQAIFSAPRANVISADLNEIAPEADGVLTAFTAASLAAGDHRMSSCPRPDPQRKLIRHSLAFVAMRSLGGHVLLDYVDAHGILQSTAEALVQGMRAAPITGGARVLMHHLEWFDGTVSPPGFASVVLLDESHISAHCYADEGLIAIDVFTCGQADPSAIADDIDERVRRLIQGARLINRSDIARFIPPPEDA